MQKEKRLGNWLCSWLNESVMAAIKSCAHNKSKEQVGSWHIWSWGRAAVSPTSSVTLPDGSGWGRRRMWPSLSARISSCPSFLVQDQVLPKWPWGQTLSPSAFPWECRKGRGCLWSTSWSWSRTAWSGSCMRIWSGTSDQDGPRKQQTWGECYLFIENVNIKKQRKERV